MKKEMSDYGLPEPEFIEERDSFKVIFRNTPINEKNTKQEKNELKQKHIEKIMEKVLEFCVEPKSAKEICDFLKLNSRSYVFINIIKPLISSNKLERTNKIHANASNQKYKVIK